MFKEKLKTLYPQKKDNKFIQGAMKGTHETESWNGALKYDTSGNDFVDQFANIGRYITPRTYSEVDKDMRLLWSQDPLKAVKLSVYIRLITRKSVIIDGENKEVTDETQKGAGMKNEGIMRMLWLAINQPKTFKANIPIFIAAGSWKDLFEMLRMDVEYNGFKHSFDWNFIGDILCAGIVNPETTHLVRKYMPQIRSSKARTTIHFQADTYVGKWFAHRLFPNSACAYKEYRHLKSEGIAHQWQQLISKQLYDKIDFNKIAGRALAKLVGSNFLANHGLQDKFSEWISSKTEVKYTGFVFEIFKGLRKNTPQYQKDTINAQFETLTKEKIASNLLVVRDVSGSMGWSNMSCGMTPHEIARAMTIYFSGFLKGPFSNHYLEFNRDCKMVELKGKTPVDKWLNDRGEAYGNTNFQAAIDVLIDLKEKGIPESDFPEGILGLSDGEFDICGQESNFQLAFKKLSQHFSKEFVDNFKIILWDINQNRKQAVFEDFANAKNCFHISGFDGSVISFLIEGGEFKRTPTTNKELFEAAMDQTILNKLVVL